MGGAQSIRGLGKEPILVRTCCAGNRTACVDGAGCLIVGANTRRLLQLLMRYWLLVIGTVYRDLAVVDGSQAACARANLLLPPPSNSLLQSVCSVCMQVFPSNKLCCFWVFCASPCRFAGARGHYHIAHPKNFLSLPSHCCVLDFIVHPVCWSSNHSSTTCILGGGLASTLFQPSAGCRPVGLWYSSELFFCPSCTKPADGFGHICQDVPSLSAATL